MNSKYNVLLKQNEQTEIDEELINLIRLQKELDEKLRKLSQRLFLIIEE